MHYLLDQGMGRLTEELQHPRFELSQAFGRQELATHVLGRLTNLVHPISVWRIDLVDQKGFYELYWDDFAIECQDRILLLYLGASD